MQWGLWTVCSVALCFGKIRAGGQEGEGKGCGWRGLGGGHSPQRTHRNGDGPLTSRLWLPVMALVLLTRPPSNCAPGDSGSGNSFSFGPEMLYLVCGPQRKAELFPQGRCFKPAPPEA